MMVNNAADSGNSGRIGSAADATTRPADFRHTYVEAANAAVAEGFKGVSAGGGVVPGLFPIRSTGVSTKSIQRAAEAFLASLSAEQRAKTLFPVETDEWRRWSNIHRTLMRHGALFAEMSPAQQEHALGLLRESLSARGFETARDIMRLNYTVAELTGRWDEYGDDLYWLSIMGTPSNDEPWGWQIDGHHLIVNYFVLGDQIVATPMFMGSEPVSAADGKYAGTRVFEAEEQNGLALLRALTSEQRTKTIIAAEVPRELFTTAFRDNFELKYEGIRHGELTSAQQSLLLKVVETYVGRTRPGHAEVKLDEVKRHLGETYFAWMGGHEGDDSVFYYRVHSPVTLIEFDHQRGLALPPKDIPNRNHIHTVVRTPNGNDYGKDLLRRHHEQFDHSRPVSAGTASAPSDAV